MGSNPVAVTKISLVWKLLDAHSLYQLGNWRAVIVGYPSYILGNHFIFFKSVTFLLYNFNATNSKISFSKKRYYCIIFVFGVMYSLLEIYSVSSFLYVLIIINLNKAGHFEGSFFWGGQFDLWSVWLVASLLSDAFVAFAVITQACRISCRSCRNLFHQYNNLANKIFCLSENLFKCLNIGFKSLRVVQHSLLWIFLNIIITPLHWNLITKNLMQSAAH